MQQTARLLLSCLVLATGAITQSPVISEFVASNSGGLKDRDGDSSDWIEIHNPSSSALDLGGWYLTDSATNLNKWALPKPTVLAAGGFLVVFASAKDRSVANQELHTDFKLSASGEFLGLVRPDARTVVSSYAPQYPQQYTDVSFGFSFNPNLTTNRVYFLQATPGAKNGVGGAVVTDVKSTPAVPKTTDDIVVEGKVVLPPGTNVNFVSLIFRVGFASSQTLPMRDDGMGRDRVRGDGIWTGVIPAAAHAPGQLVRWKIWAWLTPLGFAFAPPNRSAPDSAEFYGAVIEDPNLRSTLPILQWFVADPNAAETPGGTRCSVWFRNEYYDNVFVRRRGGSSSGWTKKNFKFDFNPGEHFLFDPNEERVEEFNLNSTWSDKSYVRRILSWETYRDAGSPWCIAQPMRVQQNGRFFSVAVFIEQPDERMLRRNDLDPAGALYKMFNPITSATQSVEKKTRRWENNSDLQRLVSGIQLQGQTLERYLFDNVDLPATISYLVGTALIHDNDHVHKNHYLYRDTEGDGEWQFIPWDKDLTLGRNFVSGRGVLNDILWATRDPQSHPLYGDRSHPKIDRFWNRLIDACYRTPRIRQMFLRRLRTVMDRLLQDPSTPRQSRYYEQRMDVLRALMTADVGRDRARWGIPSWGDRTIDFVRALGRLENSYFQQRRRHFFVTHSASTNGIIPAPQKTSLNVGFGAIEASPASGNDEEQFIEIVNCEAVAVDLSGWRLADGVRHTFAPGSVVPAGGSAFLSPNPRAFRARRTGPRGGQALLVLGPYSGKLRSTERVQLFDANGREVTRVGGLSYELTTGGAGDMRIAIAGATPRSNLFPLMSGLTNHRLGCGPLLGLGNDALWSASLPVNSAPFHVLADATGRYSFSAPPGTLPRGLTIDSRVIEFDPATASVRLSRIVRVRF